MDVRTVLEVLNTLNELTPLGVIGLLATVIYLLVAKSGPVRKLTENHAAHMQAALERIADSNDRLLAGQEKQTGALDAIKTDIAIVKDRLPRK